MQDTQLESFIKNVTGDSHLRVQDDLGDGFVRLKAAEAQRRQAKQDIRSFEDVVIEMLRNSRDAHASVIFIATWKEQSTRHMTVIDDGDGIPPLLHETVFEPFVTSKLDSFHSDRWGVHGRGMALYSIRSNTNEAQVIRSDKEKGSVFHVSVSSEMLGEKRDQSTYPKIVYDDGKNMLLRGPHNIFRTIMEFAIDERDSVRVYCGSPVEIAATLYAYGEHEGREDQLSLRSSLSDLPFVEWLSRAYDVDNFFRITSHLALPLSKRSARRIMDGSIVPLKPFLSLLSFDETKQKCQTDLRKDPSTFNALRDPRGLKITNEDLDAFKQRITFAFEPLSQAYYLNPDIDPVVKVHKDRIVVSFSITKEH